MEFILTSLSLAAAEFFAPMNLLLLVAGVAAGLIVGAIPGFSVSMGLVLFLPFTFGMSAVAGLTTMLGILTGGSSGAMVSAILLGIPGTPASYATTFDGFPMLRQGRAGLALGLGVWSSFFGGLIGWCVLVVIAPTISTIGLEFGPWDYFSLIFFALTIAASLSGKDLVKGLLAGSFGVLLASVGTDQITNMVRLSWDSERLAAGFDVMPVLVGVFALAQIMEDLEDRHRAVRPMVEHGGERVTRIEHRAAIREILRQPLNVLRSSMIGVFVGVVPAIGAQISNIIAYDQAKRASRTPERFGTGVTEGVIAPESCNNATAGGSLSILMSLGIPGDVVTVVLLGALTIHNVAPSPTFIRDEPVIAYTIFLAFLLGTVVMVGLQALGLRIFVLITRLRLYVVMGVVLFFCAMGVFAWSNTVDELWTMLLFGVIGYGMKLLGFPLAPFVLGIVLGPVGELNLIRSIQTSDDLALFVTRPWSLFFLILALFSILFPFYERARNRRASWSAFYSPALALLLALPLAMMGGVRIAGAAALVACAFWLGWRRWTSTSISPETESPR